MPDDGPLFREPPLLRRLAAVSLGLAWAVGVLYVKAYVVARGVRRAFFDA